MSVHDRELLIWPLTAQPPLQARWIAPANVEHQHNTCFRARKSFRIRGKPSSSVLHIAAESYYRLFVNGIDVGRGPVRGTRAVSFFDSYDITSLLNSGENCLAVAVQSPNLPTFKVAPVETAVLIQIDGDTTITTDQSWQVQIAPDWRSDVPLYTFQIGYMEWHDLRNEPAGWKTGEDNGKWDAAVIVAEDHRIGGKVLLPRDIPALHERRFLPTELSSQAATPRLSDLAETSVAQRMSDEVHLPHLAAPNLLTNLLSNLHPELIEPLADGQGISLIFDFRHEVNGRFEIDITAPAGTIMDVGYEEELVNGRLDLTHFSYLFADRYVLREGRQTVSNVFAERGFRYLQIVLRNFDRPVRLHKMEAIERLYPYSERGSFQCSDPLLNKIWSACVQTLKVCSTDTLVDCPWRENTLYFNDMLVAAVTSLQVFGDARIIARCYRLAVSQALANGLLPSAVPVGVLPDMDTDASRIRMTIPSASMLLPSMLEEYLLYTGDEAMVQEFIEPVLKILTTFATWEDVDGLITLPKEYWNMIDWSYPNGSLDGLNTSTLNWMHVGALNATARLLGALGDQRDVSPFKEKAAIISRAIDRGFWDESKQAYIEYFDDEGKPKLISQLSHAAAVLSGELPENRMAASVVAMQSNAFLAPELFKHHLVLRALATQRCGQAALDRIREHWGPIVMSGSSTIWEMNVHQHGKSAFEGAGSICHAFSTTPVDFFQSIILGVRPLEPGFRRCRISPQTLDLDQASGSVPTPMGNLRVAWQRSADEVKLQLEVPHGMIAILDDGREMMVGRHELEVS